MVAWDKDESTEGEDVSLDTRRLECTQHNGCSVAVVQDTRMMAAQYDGNLSEESGPVTCLI